MPTRFVTNPRRNPSSKRKVHRAGQYAVIEEHDGRLFFGRYERDGEFVVSPADKSRVLATEAGRKKAIATYFARVGAKANPRKYDEDRDGEGFRKLSDLKRGEFFKRKADARKVYRKGDYDRSERKYACDDEDDISRTIYLKGDALVFVGFDY